MQDTFITMGPLTKGKFGGTYQVSASVIGARALGASVPVWSAKGAIATVPTDAAGVNATMLVPATAIGGTHFQLTVTATLPGSPPIIVSESQSIDLTP